MIGERLGPYQIDSELGSGGMGQVFAATVQGRAGGLAVGSRVALKVVHAHLLETPGFFKRFLREAEIGRTVEHPNVVRTLDADVFRAADGVHHVLVMELLDGQTLRNLLDEMGRVPEELCRHVGAEIARGLAAIHAAGIVHRDLKPENVLITPEHAVKIMDLGVAKLMDETVRLSRTGAFVGSLRYAAPEQFDDHADDLDGRLDLYSLGVTLFELMSGRSPYGAHEGSAASVIRGVLQVEPQRLRSVVPDASPFFDELIMKLLAKDRNRRFRSADQLAAVLDEGRRSTWWTDRAQLLRSTGDRPVRTLPVARETDVHGREPELALLRDGFAAARSGRGQVVLLRGEAGVGKTRLIDELARRLVAADEALHFLFGSFPPGAAAAATAAPAQALRDHLGLEGLEAALAEYLPDTPLLVPAFAALLRGDATPRGAEPLTPASLQTVLMQALRRLSEERPCLLFLDDVQRAPPEGLALIAALASALREHRVLLVVGARSGLPDDWIAEMARLEQSRDLTLGRLGAKDLGSLLAQVFGSQRLADRLGMQIARTSDGNPFFVFEILRGLREANSITQTSDGSWASTEAVTSIVVPSSIREMVAARLAGLDDEDRDLLDVAACCGFTFDPLLIGEVVGLRRIPLLKQLARIARSHRLLRSDGDRYVFDHPQVRDVLYEGLSDPLQREYHSELADALTGHLDGELPEREVELVEHLLGARRGAAALAHFEPALRHLDATFRAVQAVDLVDRALQLPVPADAGRRTTLLLGNADRLDLLGRRTAERDALDAAAAAADETGDPLARARVRNALGRHLCMVAQFDAAGEALEQALRLAEQCGDVGLAARARGTLGSVRHTQGRHAEALALHTLHLEHARAEGDHAGVAGALGNVGSDLIALGRLDEAAAALDECLATARRIGDRRRECLASGNLGMLREHSGEQAAAIALHEDSLRIAREIGDRAAEARAALNAGNALLGLGRFTDALSRYERGLELARDMGDMRVEARAIGNRGSAQQALGRYADAERSFRRYVELAQRIGDREGEAIALVNLGMIEVGLGRWDDAEASFAAARRVCDDIGNPMVAAYADLGEGRAALGRENPLRAVERLEASLAAHGRVGNRGGAAETLVELGVARAAGGAVTEGVADLTRAAELGREIDLAGVLVVALAERVALTNEDADSALVALRTRAARLGVSDALRAHMALHRATQDAEHLEKARALLSRIVADAPADSRKSVVENVPSHRAVREALDGPDEARTRIGTVD